MKIAFIGQKGIPAISGGVEKHVEELAVRLAAQGHEVIVYTRPNYCPAEKKEFKGVRLISLPTIPTKHLDAISHTFFACLHVIFRAGKLDIVHFHSIGPSSMIGLLKLFKPRTPIIATFHTQCYFHKKWGSFAQAYLKFGEWACHKFADKVIVVSKSLAGYSKDKYQRNARYIPNGATLNKAVPAKEITEKWGLEKESYILAVSRLIRHKGLHHLIAAYNKLNEEAIKVKLVIVGDGSYTDGYVKEIKKLAQGNKNIIFTGRQSGRALEELFSNALFFVQPSESEGLSIALLEAMSYGLGVLASDIPENKEAVQDAGYYFKTKDAADFKDKLEKVLARPEVMREKGAEARERVKKFYDWDVITEETARVYEQEITKGSKAKEFIIFKALKKLAYWSR